MIADNSLNKTSCTARNKYHCKYICSTMLMCFAIGILIWRQITKVLCCLLCFFLTNNFFVPATVCLLFAVVKLWFQRWFNVCFAYIIYKQLLFAQELLEMQFDYNLKFKTEINKMTAQDLRSQPIGKDRTGNAYWIQCDENCHVRIYKEDLDEETWTLVAK